MLKFHLLLPEHLLSFEEIIDCFKIYSSFYHSVTFKNRRNSKLILLSDDAKKITYSSYLKELEIEEPFTIKSFAEYAPENNTTSFVLLFGQKENREFIINCLERQIAIIALSSPERKEILDTSCSILIPNKAIIDNLNMAIQTIKNLYFDPEVRKHLIKGCLKKLEVIRELNIDSAV